MASFSDTRFHVCEKQKNGEKERTSVRLFLCARARQEGGASILCSIVNKEIFS